MTFVLIQIAKLLNKPILCLHPMMKYFFGLGTSRSYSLLQVLFSQMQETETQVINWPKYKWSLIENFDNTSFHIEFQFICELKTQNMLKCVPSSSNRRGKHMRTGSSSSTFNEIMQLKLKQFINAREVVDLNGSWFYNLLDRYNFNLHITTSLILLLCGNCNLYGMTTVSVLIR